MATARSRGRGTVATARSRDTEACTTDIEIHSDTLKHSPLGLLSSYRDALESRSHGPHNCLGAPGAFVERDLNDT